ncbi:MAG: N-acetyltransferase [Oligoflexia bacterium]|nr:N-acetyltransferase [Oligoflexia bacterium]
MTIYIHPSVFIDQPCEIGDGTSIWHFCHLMKNVKLGKDCKLGQNVFVASGVLIGDNVKIQNNVSLYSGVVVEDDVFLGPSCVLTNISNPRSEIVRRDKYESTLIRRGATVGANATVVCGVELGRFCFIAAGAVIRSDVPPYALMAGVPARQIGWASRHGHRLSAPDGSGIMTCPESGWRYRLDAADSLTCLDFSEEKRLGRE